MNYTKRTGTGNISEQKISWYLPEQSTRSKSSCESYGGTGPWIRPDRSRSFSCNDIYECSSGGNERTYRNRIRRTPGKRSG